MCIWLQPRILLHLLHEIIIIIMDIMRSCPSNAHFTWWKRNKIRAWGCDCRHSNWNVKMNTSKYSFFMCVEFLFFDSTFFGNNVLLILFAHWNANANANANGIALWNSWKKVPHFHCNLNQIFSSAIKTPAIFSNYRCRDLLLAESSTQTALHTKSFRIIFHFERKWFYNNK